MTAADLLYGRGGGRHIPPNAVLPGIDDVPLISAICAHRHRWLVAEREIGRPCFHCGHALRRATAADAGEPVIVVAFVPPDSCPCGSAA